MGLLRRKPAAGERAASATREAAVDASEWVQSAAEQSREAADRAAEKLHRRATKAQKKAESAGRRADKAGRKAARSTRRAAKSTTSSIGAAATGLLSDADLKDRSADRAAAKADRKVSRAAARADAGARKKEAKAAIAAEKGRLKSEVRAAKAAESERAAREWNVKRVNRYLGIARLLAPAVAPYAMAAAGSLRHRIDDHRSRKLGVSPDELGGYSGSGGKLHARMSRIARTIAELREDGTTDRDPAAKKFADTTEPRLHDLAAAVRAAENMPSSRRKAAFRTVSQDLDRIEVQLLDHLGVRS